MSLPPINSFDAVLVIAVMFGVYRGTKTGARPQIFGFCRWTLMLVIGSFLYAEPARWLSNLTHVQPDVASLIVYPFELVAIGLIYEFVSYRLEFRKKMAAFGRSGNSVAMLAGAARLFIMLLTAMAWLSGKYVTEKNLRNSEESFCNYFISTIHNDVFHGSFSGRFAQKHLKPVLMEPLPHIDYSDSPKPAVARKPQLKEIDLGVEGKEKTNTVSLKEPPTNETKEVIYHNLTLRGIIINSSKKRFALINDQTFHEGGFTDLKIEGKKIKLRCFGISEDDVKVRVVGKTNIIALKMNVMTDLDGQPVPPPKHELVPAKKH